MIEGLFQPMHLLVIFGIALLVFGPKKLPELGKGIGDGIRGFKTAIKQIDEGSENSTKPQLNPCLSTLTFNPVILSGVSREANGVEGRHVL